MPEQVKTSETTCMVYSGTSGLVLPVAQSSYPEEFRGASRLTYYSSLCNSVEINSSFYKMPKVATVNKWVESVGADFRFTFKLLKDITHVKALNFSPEEVETFLQVISGVGSKKGCLLIQFPPGLKIEQIEKLHNLLQCIEISNADKWKLAIEFRSTTWYHGEVYELLAKYDASMVIHDLPASATPLNMLDSDIKYLRFHGPGGTYRGSYSDDFLLRHADSVKDWLSKGKTVYIYFNNTMGSALNNLQTLNHFIRS
jgi:uncharacterized protein YecE (DUF72 family)